MLTVEFNLSGPLFDGRADKALEDYTDAVERYVADRGEALTVRHVEVLARRKSGYYESHIRNRAVSDGYLITDSRVVYGPWLEGTSRRNESTRFKGYATFRLTTGQLNRSAVYLAESIIDPYLDRMGGRRT
jgi:hypothetical protein